MAENRSGVPCYQAKAWRHAQMAGAPSVVFDAVIAILMPDAAAKLASDSGAVRHRDREPRVRDLA